MCVIGWRSIWSKRLTLVSKNNTSLQIDIVRDKNDHWTLTHFGLARPYAVRNLVQHWFRCWLGACQGAKPLPESMLKRCPLHAADRNKFLYIFIQLTYFLSENMNLKMSSAKGRPFCSAIYVLNWWPEINVVESIHLKCKQAKISLMKKEYWIGFGVVAMNQIPTVSHLGYISLSGIAVKHGSNWRKWIPFKQHFFTLTHLNTTLTTLILWLCFGTFSTPKLQGFKRVAQHVRSYNTFWECVHGL